ncbi:FMN-dependent NADH-azoreductase [Ramlibacter algicola]|uniref:FMN dependent NADH:quinone oxidoreductase n=1 Tax=Ramlibacter algicola TaxID=2795217 RepID=A0A934Q2C0_9BURK|nr:NAD(P)H-dependent oxidoreductase [Ramlibacter algicola]MBK0393513.1 NAD(P)H-dependent oxidoreductase [Ramlibacter algicola]
MKLLHLDSSPLAAQSASRVLTARIVGQWLAKHPGTTVERLDLAADAPSHLDADSLGFRLPADAEGLTDAQRRENAVSERLVSQFLAADVVVLGAPMYNFSIPSQLKAWIDRIAQAGRTFRYTEKGPEGLAGGKTVIVASTRGGVHAEGSPMEHQESYLRAMFGFLGVTDVRIVRAEGLAMGPEARSRALEAAEGAIAQHTADDEALVD